MGLNRNYISYPSLQKVECIFSLRKRRLILNMYRGCAILTDLTVPLPEHKR